MSKATSQTKDLFTEENKKAEEYLEANDLPAAARILVDIVEKDPQNWRAYNNMGIICWLKKEWFDAYNMFLKSVLLCPDYADALMNLFDAALKLKKIEEVAPLFEKACEVNPELEEIAVIRDSIKEEGEAIYNSKRALEIGIYRPLIEDAKRELDNGNLYTSMDIFLKSLEVDGPSADAYCGLGIISYYQERYEEAFTLFLEALKINPIDEDIYLNMFDAAAACNKIEEAKAIFNAYLKEFPELSKIKDAIEKKEEEKEEKKEKD
ncbi:MAG: tetratricopeptide repeat protein [Chitinispirillaceae bacterium]|nr:tetratricopeptide repeat protein [Chitinispirillaceae bacterium]